MIANIELECLENNIIALQQNPSNNNLNTVIGKLSDSLYNSAKTCKITEETNELVEDERIDDIFIIANNAFQSYSSGLIQHQQWEMARKEAVKKYWDATIYC